MEKSEARAVVDENVSWLLWAMGLNHWRIDIEYVSKLEPEGTIACCRPDPAYRRANIAIAYADHDDKEHLLSSLVHELSHVLHASFETYRKQVAHLVDEKVFESIDEMFRHACENTVEAVDGMLVRGLGLDAASMIERARAVVADRGEEPEQGASIGEG